MAKNQILAVWGSPSSGKTVTSIKIARELASKRKNVIVVLCNSVCPTLPTLLPSVTVKSLGEVLSLPIITQDDVIAACSLYGKSEYISLMGYVKCDNAFTYAKYSKERTVDLLVYLRSLADYIIFDCESILSNDSVLTYTALEVAQNIIRLDVNDLKSTAYFQSNLPLISMPPYYADRHKRVLSGANGGLGGKADYVLPYLPSLTEQFESYKLLENLTDKEAKTYDTAISKIVDDLLMERKK